MNIRKTTVMTCAALGALGLLFGSGAASAAAKASAFSFILRSLIMLRMRRFYTRQTTDPGGTYVSQWWLGL